MMKGHLRVVFFWVFFMFNVPSVFSIVIGVLCLGLLTPFSHMGGFYDPNSIFIWGLTGFILVALSIFSGRVITIPILPVGLIGIVIFSIFLLWIIHGAPYRGLVSVSVLLVWCAIIVFLWTYRADLIEGRRFIERSLVFLALFACGLAAFHPYYFDFDFSYSPGSGLGVISHGGFGQRNNFPTFLTTVIALIFWLNISFENRSNFSVAQYFIIFVLSLFVFMSASRVGLLTLTVLFFLFSAAILKKGNVAFVIRVVAVAVFSFFTAEFLRLEHVEASSILGRVSLSGVQESSINGRIGYIFSGVHAGLDRPIFGWGFDSFYKVYPQFWVDQVKQLIPVRYLSNSTHPHNELIQWWVSGGLLGVLGVFLPFFLIFAVAVFKGRTIVIDSMPFVPVLIHSLTGFPLYQSPIHWLLLAVGLVLVLAKNLPACSFSTSIGCSKVLRAALVVGLIGFSVAAMEAVYTGHKVFFNFLSYANSNTLAEYVNSRANDRELTHWLYGADYEAKDVRSKVRFAMSDGDGEAVGRYLNDMKAATQRFNDQNSWSLLAASFAGLGKVPELIGFIDYIYKLDPEYATGMAKAYGLPEPK